MNASPAVSFIMPAFNAADFIGQAIGSIIAQTFTDWELIVVDDGSTDNTLGIINEYAAAESRIKVIYRDEPSGSPFIPRRDAIREAKAEIIAPLDADDRIDPDYLEKLLEIKQKNKAQTVYPLMYFIRNSITEPFMDLQKYVPQQPMNGPESVRLTLDGWKVSCNGGVFDKKIYLKAFEMFGDEHYDCNADETLTRWIIFLSETVVFSRVRYLFRINPDSVTHKVSVRKFDILKSCVDVNEMLAGNFGKNSEEYLLGQKQLINTILDCIQYVYTNDFSGADRELAFKAIESARSALDRETLGAKTSFHLNLISRMPIPAAAKILALRAGIKELFGSAKYQLKRPARKCRHIKKKLKDNRSLENKLKIFRNGQIPEDSESGAFYRENYFDTPRKNSSGNSAAMVDESVGTEDQTLVICPFDGSMYHGGTTDRIRGVLSTFDEVSKRGIPFRISWTSPFRLEDYLEPAEYDWRINPSEVHHVKGIALPVVIQDKDNRTSDKILKAALDGLKGEIHVYSNSDSSIGRYHKLYTTLFRPTPRLSSSVNGHKAHLGRKYWAFHLRFLRLLGDFKDWSDEVLAEKDAIGLMTDCRNLMLKIIRNLPEGYGIFVTSDSRRFLNFIADADPRIYITPGDIRNIDLAPDGHEDIWLKAFTDQQLLMDAERVYRITLRGMYPSGFSRFAAEVGGAEFIDIRTSV